MAMLCIGIYLSRKGKNDSTTDYFLASKALPWWAVGGSLIASNISAEQFIGMSGSGYVVGMAIASYELMAALTLVLVAKFFLPVFIKNGIYTMPQFLELRYDRRVRMSLGVFWLLLFVFVNITSVLYLGGLAVQNITGLSLIWAVIGLALYAASFSIFGGLKAVVWTDVIQVVVLLFGGVLAAVLVLQAVGGGVFSGLSELYEKAPEKFDMILDKSNPEYMNLPGISVLVGGMWIANVYYWGTNQYIIQRSLAAKSLGEAQLGTVFAAFIKLLLPLVVVIPGIAAFVLGADIIKNDEAYPWVLNNYVSTGFKGLAFAALIAAIGSSLSSIVNSASTIFTLDVYALLNKDKSEKQLVNIGKITSASCLIIGVIVAPLLGNLDQAFQFIQEYTGFISPGVVAIFILGIFWKKATANSAFISILLSIPLSMAIKTFLPQIPFMNRMGIVFLLSVAVMIAVSLIQPDSSTKRIELSKDLFKTSGLFNVLTLVIIGILAAFYALLW
jgi:SSS family solute:Na+ symporter